MSMFWSELTLRKWKVRLEWEREQVSCASFSDAY